MRFRYEAVKQSGESLKGEIDAATEADAYRLLQSQDLMPVALAPVSDKRGALDRVIVARRANTRDRAIVIRELATLLGAGVPLAEAVASLAEAHAGDSLGAALGVVHGQLRNGVSLPAALREANMGVPDYVHQLVAAGELTGKLAPSLFAGADQMEYEESLRQEMRNALIYPSVLVFSGIAAVLLIFLVVVPKFAGLLNNRRAHVPAISVWVLKTGLFVKTHLMWFGLGGAGLAFFAFTVLSNPRMRASLLEAIARLPLLGGWLLDTEVGRWSAMLGTLLENRVPIVRAMELAQGSVVLQSLRLRLDVAGKDLRSGKKLADALALHRTVSPMGINLVRVGERTGELPTMLKTLARMYETASRTRMKRFLLLLEPIAILTIGVVIGFIMVAIMLAITSLSNITF
ncbi:MAG: type II secretion system F family protein [Burkholderiales bacterium]|nr:type II secretion system F family protein [Burkholderiales bacterium]